MNHKHHSGNSPSQTAFGLKLADQQTLFGVLTCCFIALLTYTVWGYASGRVSVDSSRPVDVQVDINTAHWTELATIPGLGETLCRKIVAFREQNGPIQSFDELLQLNGMSELRLNLLRQHAKPLPH